jgi:uncharacterized membrane protein
MSPWNRIYSEVNARASRSDRAEGPARAALLAGVTLSGLLLISGLVALFLRGETSPNEPPPLCGICRGIVAFHGPSLLYAGLLVLAFTPVLRVIVMTVIYARRHERFMLIISVVVLSLLVAGLIAGTG